ncbi:MAG: 2-oxo acid dehydrogenase subunit E2 [Propionibacteriales bacterium]|nr:2-oxo acid dehydrogenase subunit E2 [Propionibacteriales bacterium]
MPEFTLPDPGEGLQEAEIVRWLVAVGDTVAVNDILVEIETAKSLVELPSPYAGVVTALLVAEGDDVPVGTPIIRIGEDVATTPDVVASGPVLDAPDPAVISASEPASATPPAEAERTAMLVGYGAKSGAVSRRPRKSSGVVAVPETDQVADAYDTANPVSRKIDEVTPSDRLDATASGEYLPPPGRPSASARGGRRPLATPAVRRVARDLGVDLNQLVGSGANGLITAEDVVAAAAGGLPGRDRRTPLRGVRREMFKSMTASLQVPQATAMIEADVTGSVEMLELLKARREFTGLRVSPLLVFAKAACLAISKIPEINSSYDAERDEVVLHGAVNLGIAAATPRGLMVPNIKNAERMNLVELTQALNAMVSVAREGRVQPYDLANGTFTITNIGVFGVDGGTPILSPGEAAIMCLGTIRRKPWVVGTGEDERIEPRSVCTVSLTFDHRLVDGEMASKFLAEVATIMSNPGLALLF